MMVGGVEPQPLEDAWPDGIILRDVRLGADEEAACAARLTPSEAD
jgi:hypothetical protein